MIPTIPAAIIDPRQELELARLMEQDRLITQAMGGALPEYAAEALGKGTRILDLACGPAGWAMDVAFQFAGVQVYGVDNEPKMIQYARARAASQGLAEFAHFRVMNITQPLAFEDEQFDMIKRLPTC
jgi:ubiquinone/menaquinone biosynthesis C-methylase UbiE